MWVLAVIVHCLTITDCVMKVVDCVMTVVMILAGEWPMIEVKRKDLMKDKQVMTALLVMSVECLGNFVT